MWQASSRRGGASEDTWCRSHFPLGNALSPGALTLSESEKRTVWDAASYSKSLILTGQWLNLREWGRAGRGGSPKFLGGQKFRLRQVLAGFQSQERRWAQPLQTEASF